MDWLHLLDRLRSLITKSKGVIREVGARHGRKVNGRHGFMRNKAGDGIHEDGLEDIIEEVLTLGVRVGAGSPWRRRLGQRSYGERSRLIRSCSRSSLAIASGWVESRGGSASVIIVRDRSSIEVGIEGHG